LLGLGSMVGDFRRLLLFFWVVSLDLRILWRWERTLGSLGEQGSLDLHSLFLGFFSLFFHRAFPLKRRLLVGRDLPSWTRSFLELGSLYPQGLPFFKVILVFALGTDPGTQGSFLQGLGLNFPHLRSQHWGHALIVVKLYLKDGNFLLSLDCWCLTDFWVFPGSIEGEGAIWHMTDLVGVFIGLDHCVLVGPGTRIRLTWPHAEVRQDDVQ